MIGFELILNDIKWDGKFIPMKLSGYREVPFSALCIKYLQKNTLELALRCFFYFKKLN